MDAIISYKRFDLIQAVIMSEKMQKNNAKMALIEKEKKVEYLGKEHEKYNLINKKNEERFLKLLKDASMAQMEED